MGLFSRRRRPAAGPGEPAASPREAQQATVEHLRAFATSRVGVEGYLEPATNVTQTTLMLIAADGEWTRRRVPDGRAAHDLTRSLAIPLYDVQRTGYPQRMRDYNSRQRILRERAARERAERRASGAPEPR